MKGHFENFGGQFVGPDPELHRRQALLDRAGLEDIERWNAVHPGEPLPYILVVVDEVAELSALTEEKVSSRRGMLKLAGAAAIGAVGVGAVSTQKAAAATGGNMIIGQSNSAGVGDVTSLVGTALYLADDTSASNGTRSPVSPGTTISGMPPTAEATTGVSHAIASRLMMPNGSYTEGQTNTAACA